MATKLFSRAKNGSPQSAQPAAPSKTASDVLVSIDFPQEDEKVVLGHYAIRLTTYVGGATELSINKGDWKPCRAGIGHHWFDWWTDKVGPYTLEARVKTAAGQVKKSPVRSCSVVKPKKG